MTQPDCETYTALPGSRRSEESENMLVEVRISPVGKDSACGEGVANIRRLIENSRNAFCLTPSGAWIEGERREVVNLLQRCHSQAHSRSIRLMATSYAGRNRRAS